jgi:hypothetical protein
MSSQALEQVVGQIKKLSTEEQVEVRNLLNQIPLTPEEIDRQFQERLLKAGLISEIKPLYSSLKEEAFEPIKVIGEPVSETIIRERR